MPVWLTATLAALPALVDGIEAFRAKRASLMAIPPGTDTSDAVIAEDDAELARRRAAAAAPGPAPKP